MVSALQCDAGLCSFNPFAAGRRKNPQPGRLRYRASSRGTPAPYAVVRRHHTPSSTGSTKAS